MGGRACAVEPAGAWEVKRDKLGLGARDLGDLAPVGDVAGSPGWWRKDCLRASGSLE